MSLLDDIKAKADLNGDQKISQEDLESLKDGNNDGIIGKFKEMADQNGDGQLNLDDIKNFDIGNALGGIKDRFSK